MPVTVPNYGPNVDVVLELPVAPSPLTEFDAFSIMVRGSTTDPNNTSPNYIRLQCVNWSGTQLDAIGDALSFTQPDSYFWGDQVIPVTSGDAFGLRADGDTMTAYHRVSGVWSVLFSATPGYLGGSTLADSPQLRLAGWVGVYFGSAFNPGSFSGPQYDNFSVAEWTGTPPAFPAPATASDTGDHPDGTFLTVGGQWVQWFNLINNNLSNCVYPGAPEGTSTGSYQ